MYLHEYQKRACNFLAVHPSAILAVDMGLGKTATVLHFLDWMRRSGNPYRTLIIAPKRVAETAWKQEAERWGLSIADDMVIVSGTPKQRAEALSDDSHPVKVIGRDNFKDYAGKDCDVLVLDELTSFKSIKSSRYKAVASIKAPRRIGLTGTFLANGAIDIYGQASAVGLLTGYRNFYSWRGAFFRDAVAGAGLPFQKWVLRQPLTEVLKDFQSDTFTLTAEDYLHLPDLTETIHPVTLSKDERTAYDDLQDVLCCEINGEVLPVSERAKFAKLQTICDGFLYVDDEDTEQNEKRVVMGKKTTKIDEVTDFVLRAIAEGEQVLLFYAFTAEKDEIVKRLTSGGITVDTPDTKDFIKRWEDGTSNVLIAHPASAGHGLNLQHGGRILVWSTLTWNFEFFAQANARLSRQGQERQVQRHYFIAKDTVEEKMLTALRRKERENDGFKSVTKK